MHSQLDNQILTYLMRVYNNMAHPHHPDPKNDVFHLATSTRRGSITVGGRAQPGRPEDGGVWTEKTAK